MSNRAKHVRKPSEIHSISGEETTAAPKQEEIALLAYQLWQERGCPVGTPEEDWSRAETELQRKAGTAVARMQSSAA